MTGKTRKLTDEERLEEVHQAIRDFHEDMTRQDKYLFKDGTEKMDPVPVAPPLGYKREPSMFDHMRSLIRSEMLRQALAEDWETPEEADDFEVGDDYDPRSGFEVEFDENEVPYAKAPDAEQPEVPLAKPGTPPEGVGSPAATPPPPEK